MRRHLRHLSRKHDEKGDDFHFNDRIAKFKWRRLGDRRRRKPYILQKSNCAIALDENGYMTDLNQGKRLFAKPLQMTMFDNYSLQKDGPYYILERTNTTSSRDWGTFIFTYEQGTIKAYKLITLSRIYGTAPGEINWSGFECRGEKIAQRRYSPFEAAKNSLCSGNQNPESDGISQFSSTQGEDRTLEISIPLYENGTNGTTSYQFIHSDEPDINYMQCTKNCDGYIRVGRYKSEK